MSTRNSTAACWRLTHDGAGGARGKRVRAAHVTRCCEPAAHARSPHPTAFRATTRSKPRRAYEWWHSKARRGGAPVAGTARCWRRHRESHHHVGHACGSHAYRAASRRLVAPTIQGRKACTRRTRRSKLQPWHLPRPAGAFRTRWLMMASSPPLCTRASVATAPSRRGRDCACKRHVPRRGGHAVTRAVQDLVMPQARGRRAS